MMGLLNLDTLPEASFFGLQVLPKALAAVPL